ncbi:MAG: iron transporter FeoB [Rhodospirillaceae bacterium BRH_c57]|nr:MAG: iron transporter FeoB [Rhodospirillaceae bacterium BRH_c57]
MKTQPQDTEIPEIVVGMIGNPNCGKTTLFNALTGARQHVGNWPGVTVEKKTGTLHLGSATCTLVDLPGIYSLGVSIHSSEDETVAHDYALSGQANLIVNVVDATNLERNLYLTTQLLEMRVPMVVAVNMTDIAKDRGIAIDFAALSEKLGCPVVPLVATRRKELAGVIRAIAATVALPVPPTVRPSFHHAVERALDDLSRMIVPPRGAGAGDARWIATRLLEGDPDARTLIKNGIGGVAAAKAASIEAECGEEADIVIADGRFAFISGIVSTCTRRTREASRTMSDRIDRVVLDRVLGIPVFLLMMYLMFMFTINIGGAFIDLFDQVFGAVFVEGLGDLLQSAGTSQWLIVLLANGAGGGIQTAATFIPVIGSLFLFLSLLEDSGYMARAAFVMDRAMRAIGLPGKSFVPLIVGFGCNVPAIMAARTLENRRDRVLTIMMAPFMSCGARLPVYALFAVAFFPEGGQNVVFALYLIGLAFAIGTGLLLKHTVLQGEASPFIMELPPYHMPSIGTIARRAGHRLSGFMFRAGRIIVPMVVILSFLNALGTDGSFGNENRETSVLAEAGRGIIPLFAPMGMTDDNWPAAVGIFTGVFAKEAVVGTLNTLYAQVGNADKDAAAGQAAEVQSETPAGLTDKLIAALLTVPENLARVVDTVGDPLGLDISYATDRSLAATTLNVEDSAFGAMTSRFDGAAGAFAYLLLILLYMPCVAATGAINQEIGWRWTLFSAGWTTGLGYCASVIFYQSTLIAAAPMAAGARIVGASAAVITAAWVMRMLGSRHLQRLESVTATAES